ncbi:hypothetical protein [Aquimarina longa]|uniref:hypothetical protein n=1 Tax=Aquimarina longa TaxID=1080221 RepID=UPI0007863C15|nr:hypothetical protein [Aquimarina longa]
MKYTIPLLLIIILSLILFIGHLNKNSFINRSDSITKADTINPLKCNNKFYFISSTDTIPILNLDIKTPYYLARNDISNLYYNEDLCELCSQVEFKIPFNIENENGFLKIMTDFDTPYCGKCPIPMRLRHYYHIEINNKNQLFVEDQLRNVNSLQLDIEKYLLGIGENKMGPKSFDQVNYLIYWGKGTNKMFLDSILTKIYNAHLNSVEIKIRESNKDFCLLSKKELLDLKNDYPLRIEFDLGKFEKMKENIERNFKTKVKNISL